MTIRPIFIFSAPRSGSTLVQRILAAHSQVATASEPWLLLPLLSPLYGQVPAAGARDALVHEALEDFIAELPRGGDSYRAAIRRCAQELYRDVAGEGPDYFVDKTPLYHLIVDEIVSTFPDGRFLFLFRHPLSVVASCVELFDHGRWEAPRYHMALFQSLTDLIPASARHAQRSLTVRFEDLVDGGQAPWRRILDYLDLPWEAQMLERFGSVQLRGRKGDVTGTQSYDQLSREPMDKWRATLANPLRRAWCARYLEWLGPHRLAVMGYDLSQLRRELGQCGTDRRGTWDDARSMTASLVGDLVKARLPRYSSRSSTWPLLLRG